MCFPSFVLIVIWCSTSYTVKKSALTDVKRDCYCNCLLVALHLPEMCFWPKMARKKLDFFEMHSRLWPGSRNSLRHQWKKTGYSLSFTSLFWWVWLIPLKEWVCLSYVSGFRLKISRIALWRKRLQLDSESHFTENGVILEFFVRKWPLWLIWNLYGLKSARIASIVILFDDVELFRCLGWGVIWSVL